MITGAAEGEAFLAAAAAAALQAAEFSAPHGRAGFPAVLTKAARRPPGRPVRTRGRTRSVTVNDPPVLPLDAGVARTATIRAAARRGDVMHLH